MNNRDYWQKRAEQNARRIFAYADRKAQMVTRWFGRARREMEKKILDFCRQYSQKESIPLQTAKTDLVNRRALSMTKEEARRLAELYPEDPELQRLLRQSYTAWSISRTEFLMMQLQLLESELYGEYANETGKSLNEIFEEAYYRSIFDYQQFIGSGTPAFNRLSPHQIQAAVETAWKGKNYSQRIWNSQRVSLARYLNRIVTVGMIEGKPNGLMAAELRKAMNIGAYQARRLIRTECAQVTTRANMLAYQENGTPQFQFLATLDFLTSEICRDMDGKIFDVKDGKTGTNMPPLHPFCRSTTVPYIPDEEFDAEDTRTARNGAGEVYPVPASMTYREWHKKYVEGSPSEILAEKKLKNGTADGLRYNQYKARLGKNAPETFDVFQNIKYTDAEAMKFMELDYRRRGTLLANPKLALPNAESATAADGKFTLYLFNPQNQKGWAKGQAFMSRLGYSGNNWQSLRDKILEQAKNFPAALKGSDPFGDSYEQKIILYGYKGTPANVVLGWKVKDGKTWLITAYIKEV